jgi:glycine/D-amino acid oxidase-like deaminating enzyme
MPRDTAYWLDRFPKSRRPSYPLFRGSLDTDVVIVGGGLTGCACAASFAAAGISVAVIEADRVGAGATAGAPGLVREDFDASFQTAASTYGLRVARSLWQAMRRASLDMAAALRRYEVRCDLAPQDLLSVVPRDAIAVRLLRREYDARRQAGLDHSWLTAAALTRETSLEAGGAIRTRGFVLDPYRAALGFAAAAASARQPALLFERSVVKRIRTNRKRVEVTTAKGALQAQAVIVATGAPLPDLRALRRHLRPQRSYAVVTESLPAAVRRELGARAAAVRDAASPPHFLRWLKEDRALFCGADQGPVPERARARMLVQRSNRLMYELSTIYPAISGAMPEWAWDFGYDETVDGLPYVGMHRNFPRHLFALGHGRHGAGVAWLAARVLLRLFQGARDKGDEMLGFARILR